MKRDEPQDRQRPENGRRVMEDKTVEVVRNHEDGSRMGMAFSSRRADEAERRRSADTAPERGLRGLNDGGAIFGQPHERKPGLRTGWQGPERVGNRRQGQEGRAHLNVSEDARTGRWSSKTRARRRARRSRRAAVNGQGAATSTGFFPAQAEPAEEVHGADHAPRASATSAGGSLLTQLIRSPEREGGGAPRGAARP